jgi:hypothetical protein
LAAFLTRFLRKEDKRALLSLFLEALGSSGEADSREADDKVVNSKVVYGKDIGSGKAVSKKMRRVLADFALSIF